MAQKKPQGSDSRSSWSQAGLALSLVALPAFVPAIHMQPRPHIMINAEALDLAGAGDRVVRFKFKNLEGVESGGVAVTADRPGTGQTD